MTHYGVIHSVKPAYNGELHILLQCINMDNTVGSTYANFCISKEDAYILGLWCADGYWWSSSVGLSNMDAELIKKFRIFLSRNFPIERIKFNRNHLFVNSRPLLREFREARENISELKKPLIIQAYFAGRFDGDGSISKNLKSDCRIVYSNRKETEIDKMLLNRIGIVKAKIYYYRTAKTFCLYISCFEAKRFLEKILPYSIKMQKLAYVTP